MTVAANAQESTKWLVGSGLCLAAAAVGLYAVLFERGTLAAATEPGTDPGAGSQADTGTPPEGASPTTAAAL
ncbi:hypothetical protein ACFY9F_35180 [Streptomyces sp. NPDC012421]|uniref:hypothetical protein n=1 Tax=Streptomyces sp. NPDC012421 TaxID=3364832 RepID=UPI0036E35411